LTHFSTLFQVITKRKIQKTGGRSREQQQYDTAYPEGDGQ